MKLEKNYLQDELDYDSKEIDRLLGERFGLKYNSLEECRADIIKKLEEAMKSIEEGKGMLIDEYIEGLKKKNEWI